MVPGTKTGQMSLLSLQHLLNDLPPLGGDVAQSGSRQSSPAQVATSQSHRFFCLRS